VDDCCNIASSVAAGAREQLYDGGGFIHILLVLAIIVVLVRIIQG